MLLSLEDEVFDKMLQKAKSVTLELVIPLKANQTYCRCFQIVVMYIINRESSQTLVKLELHLFAIYLWIQFHN